MKKALALVLAVLMLAALSLTAVAYSTPAELSDLFEVGVWGVLQPGVDCDPGLDNSGIKDGVHVYGLFDAAYAPVNPPAAISGYTSVDEPGKMTDGTYCVFTASSGFGYVLVMGDPKAAEPEKPAEPAPSTPAAPEAPAAAKATPTKSTVFVDGEEVSFEAYLINDNNYLKLRDLAFAINGSGKNFEVGYDEASNAITITSGKAYTVVGGEMEGKGAGVKDATPSASKITLDGAAFEPTAYFIEGNNYFKLRDIGEALDFNVSFIDGNVVIATNESYTAD